MNLGSRIAALEARQREREAADAPLYRQHADRDEDGNVIACERMVFPRNPPGLDTLGPLAAAAAAMVREPFSRSTCSYSECNHRGTCRADGRATSWGATS